MKSSTEQTDKTTCDFCGATDPDFYNSILRLNDIKCVICEECLRDLKLTILCHRRIRKYTTNNS